MDTALGKFLLVSDVIGYLLLGFAAYYGLAYLIDATNPLRHEYGIGTGMATVYGLWPALFSIISAIVLRRKLGRKMLLISVALLPLFGLVQLFYVFE